MIVYVTGAPATGKSTLCERLAELPGVQHFAYSARLRDYVNARASTALSEIDIRQYSAQAVTPEDVSAVDLELAKEIDAVRQAGGHLLIDSHPVTKEAYGFRVTPFSVPRLTELGLDRLICLYASPDVLSQRISKHPQGRPTPTVFELSMHVELQASVVAQYAVLTGTYCQLVNAERDRESVAADVMRLLKLVPASGPALAGLRAE